MGNRLEDKGKAVVPLNTQHHVRVDNDVFCAFIPLVAQAFEIVQLFTVLTFELAIDQRALTRVFAQLVDVVVIFQARIAVQPG